MAEPCETLTRTLAEHNTITMCPYCRSLFDVHVGMLFLEGKQAPHPGPPLKEAHRYFEEAMGGGKATNG